MKKLKVTLVGGIPPPFGGVSVHVERLAAFLVENGHEVAIAEFGPFSMDSGNAISVKRIEAAMKIIGSRSAIIHIHPSDMNLRKGIGFLLLSILCRFTRGKLIITFHSEFEKPENITKGIMFLNMASCIIAVARHIEQELVTAGLNPTRIRTISPFLPPPGDSVDSDRIPKGIWSFIESHQPVISANASRIAFHNGKDVYGLDMLVDLCAGLKQEFPRLGIVVAVNDAANSDYVREIMRRIREYEIEDNILLVTEAIPFYPIIEKSDIFVRPTCRDGDSVSIREALYFGVPVAASDAISRPSGTVLFRNRDRSSFAEIVTGMLRNRELYVNNIRNLESIDNGHRILELYFRTLKLKAESKSL